MKWADVTFKAAAIIRVYTKILAAINNDANFETLRKHAEEQVIRSAKFPHRSTSPYSNEMEREKLAAWANFLNDLLDWNPT